MKFSPLWSCVLFQGYGGTCAAGKCQPGSLFDTAKVVSLQPSRWHMLITICRRGIHRTFRYLYLWPWWLVLLPSYYCGRQLLASPYSLLVATYAEQLRSGLRRCCCGGRQRAIKSAGSDQNLAGLRHERMGSYDRAAGLRIGPPAVLQPGSRWATWYQPPTATEKSISPSSASFTRAPTKVDTYSRSREVTSSSRSQWVDESLYNGPRR